MSNTRGEPPFRGYGGPNYTQIPDVLFDEQLSYLSGAELKVLLYIMRRTYGFKKDSDNISLSQIMGGIITREGKILDRGTGLSRDSVTRAIKNLEEKGLILRQRRRSAERGDEATSYTLNRGPVSENRTPSPQSENQTRGGPKIGQEPVRKSDTQETVDQDTEKQETVFTSNTAHAQENVDNSDRATQKGRGGRPHGLPLLETSRSSPSPTNGKHNGTAYDPSGGRPSGLLPETQNSRSRLPSYRRDHRAAYDPTGGSPQAFMALRDLVGGGAADRQEGSPVEGSGTGRIGSGGAETPPDGATGLFSRPGGAGAGPGRRGRLPAAPYIRTLIEEFSEQLHDGAHARANVTRAIRLWQASGLEEAVFAQEVLYPARSRTRQSNVKKRAGAGEVAGLINRMPYFFAVVEDLLGLRERGAELGGPQGQGVE